MDDAEEVKTTNSEYLGKYCFVSSWTDISDESIPFWSLYTTQMSGVRIRMKKYPFEKSTYSLPYYAEGCPFETYIPASLFQRNDVYLYPTLPFLRKVEYTSDDTLIYPTPITSLNKQTNGRMIIQASFNDVGKYKRNTWAFQSEWRYSIILFPHDSQGRLNLQLEANSTDLPFYYYDCPISNEAFLDIEITTGPKMNMGDKILLQTLVEKYCPTAVIKDSSLLIN